LSGRKAVKEKKGPESTRKKIKVSKKGGLKKEKHLTVQGRAPREVGQALKVEP